MKNKILELIISNPKQFSKMIKNRPELYNWVLDNTLIAPNSNFASMVYSAVYQQSNICPTGNTMKYESISTGFIGCGHSSSCICTKNKVAKAVKKSKELVSESEQKVINEKRKETTFRLYGVTNNGQTEKAKQNHKNFYADPEKVDAMHERIKQSYLDTYGVEHCRQLPESEAKRLATLLTRYNVTNIAQIPSTKAKLNARMIEYKLTGYLFDSGYEKFTKTISDKFNFSLVTSKTEYKQLRMANNNEYTFKCEKCGTKLTKKFNYNRGIHCELCDPKPKKYISAEEQSVFDFITNTLKISNGKQSDRTIINPYELDMVFEDQKIAIEYGGLYWHSEASNGRGKTYHSDKLKMTNAKGYRLITIFSDEWLLTPNIVKSKLQHIFGKTGEKLYARKLLIKEISNSESKQFLESYHLQGHSTAKINIALINPINSEICAVMTFSSGRKALNTKNINGYYELVRFATNGSSIAGGASKILSYFVKQYHPKTLVSYADLRWSEGKVYETIGFIKDKSNAIGYWYVDDYTKRFHRFNFTKKSLVLAGGDSSKTEWGIMQELGYDRIWDCGHQKYIMEF